MPVVVLAYDSACLGERNTVILDNGRLSERMDLLELGRCELAGLAFIIFDSVGDVELLLESKVGSEAAKSGSSRQ